MGIFKKIKDWLTGGSTNSKIKSANRTSYYGGGVTSKRTQTEIKRSVQKAKEEQEEKQEQLNSAFKAYDIKTKKISEARDKREEKKTEKPDAFNKKNAYKATPPSTRRSTALGGLSESDIKKRTAQKAAADANRKEQLRTAERLKPLLDEKYGKRKSGVPTYVKQGNYAADPDVAKYNVLKHPVATSATRGAVSGATFGLSELAIQKSKKSKEAEEAERFYQANKSKGAEFAGEMAGSVASFGLTGNLSKNAVSKVFPKATAKIGASATERLATNKYVLRSAEREAIKTFGKTYTEKELAQLARAKAAKIVAAVGEDTAINLTTGAISDVTHALIDSKDPVEFAKNMAINAGMNIGFGGLTTVAPELFRGSELQNSMRAMGDDVADFGRDVTRNIDSKSGGIKLGSDAPKKADEIFESSKHRQKKTDWAIGKDNAGALWVGDPKDVSKRQYFGRDIPENRAKAQEEFDFFSSKETTTAQQKIAEEAEAKAARSARAKKAAAAKKEAESRGLKYYSDDDLVKMLKKDGNFRKLNNEEYLYYIYNRADDDPFIARIDEIYDNIDNTSKAKASEQKASAVAEAPAAKAKETKAKEVKTKEVKAKETKPEPIKSTKADTATKKTPSNKTAKTQNSATKEAANEQADTYSIKKSSLEYKKRNVEKMLKKVESEVAEKSKYASQKEMSALNSKYMSLLETKKKLEAQIEEASKSADGRITLKKGNRQAKPQIEEPEVRISKLEPEKAIEPTAKTKGKKGDVDALSTYKQNRLKENPDAKFAETKKTTAKSNKTEGKKKYDVQVEDSKGKLHETTAEASSSSEARRKGASKVQDSLEHDVEVKDAKTLGREEKAQKAKVEKKQGSAKNNKPSSAKESAKKTEKPMSKAAEARAKKAEARQRLDSLLETAEKHQAAYESGDSNALKELVATEKEAKQAYRDAGMSRSDAYKESKKLFDEHEKALKKAEKTNAKVAPKEEIFGKDKEGWAWGKTKEGDLFVGTDANREYFKDTPDNRTIVENYWKTNSFAGEEKAVKEAVAEKPPQKTKTEKKKGAKSAAETLKSKDENADVLATYKKNQKKSIEEAKAQETNTVEIGNNKYSAINESPFDEASTRTTREKPKFTPKEEAADQTAKKPKQKTKNVEGKAKQSEQKSGKAEGKSKKQKQQSEEKISQGQKEARRAYEKETGQKFEKNAESATDEQIYDAIHKYEVSQGTDHKRKLSKAASSQVRVSDTDSAKIIDNLMANTDVMEYETISHRGMYEEVAKDLNDDWDRWVDKINDVADNETWDGKEGTKLLYMSQYLSEITDATKSPEQAVLAEQAWKAIKTLSSSAGQTLNGRRTYVKLSKAAKIESAVDDLVHILDDAIGFNKKHKAKLAKLNKYERRHYIKGQIMGDPKVKECVLNLSNAKTEDAVGEAYTKLLVEFNKLNPKTGFDVVQELRYLNMLGNFKTHNRNVFGSAFFSPMRKISNTIRAGIEDSLAEKAGVEITKHGGLSPQAMMEAWSKKPKTEAGKSAQEAFERLKSDILGSSKYDTPMYKGRAKTVAGKVLDKAADFNSHLLSVEDDFFKSRAFKENYIKSYNRYLKDGVPITDKIKRQIEAESIQEAKIATFNEYNEFAKWLSDIEKNASNANATSFQRGAGVAVNAVMPFTKVPANLMKQSINYSPIGLAKGYVGIKDAIKSQDAKALNKAIDEFASGATGSTVFMLGTLLGLTSDRIKTNVGKKDYASKFEKQQGVQNYSVTLGEGDKQYSVTLDWLVPMSSVFFSGVEFADQFKENGLSFKGIGSAVTDWATVVSRLAEPVMETSMLSGLHGMLETMRNGSDSDDTLGAIAVLGRETVQSWINSMVPTALGQIARTTYSTDKMIGGVDDWDYFKSSLKNKTGLAADNAVTRALGIEPLGADTDAYGNIKGEKKNTADYLKSAAKNMLSPANIQKVDLSELDKQKIAEYRSRVKAGEDPSDLAYLFPKKQYKREFTVGDMDVKLSNKDLSTYNQAKTTGGEEGMRYILESIMFNRPTVDASGKKVPSKDAYTQEEKAALMKKFEGKSMREVEEWLYAQPQFKNASDAEKRKAINGLWSYSNQGKSNASKRVGEQAVVKAQGGDVNEYNFKNEVSEKRQEKLQAAIDGGIVTYEEAVDFARYAGKTYYYENDEGGTASTYYNKKQMLEYLEAKGYSHDKAEALFNAFKNSNAKPYGSASGRRGWGRGWHRWGHHGGGGSKKSKIKTGSFKPATVHPSKGGSSSSKTPKTSVSVKSTAKAGSGARSVNAGTTKATMPKASATPKVSVPTTRRRGTLSSGTGTGRGTSSALSTARVRASGGTKASIRVNRPTTSSRASTNIKRSQTRVNSTPKMAVTPLNIKTVKASKSRKSTNTSLAAALKDLENTKKKVAPPKARRK